MLPGLSTADWAVVACYLALVLCVGLYASGRQASTRDFFLGKRQLPWWAAALSIIASETSAVTYIGTPRMAYEGDWAFLQLVLGLVVGRLLLAAFLVPVLYSREIFTVYGFLEKRYGNSARGIAAIFFLLGRVTASGVRLFAGCLAVQVATGLPLGYSVIILGAIGMIYTLAGGIRAVVWTDVLFGLTFIAGGIVSAYYLATSLPGGLSAALSSPQFTSKTTIFHWGWSLADPNAFVAGLAGGIVLTLATHGTDQDIVQRILGCRSSRGGRLSVLGSAVLILPLMSLFLAVGTLLYLHYATQQVDYPLPANRDHLFPMFIVRELPVGFSGFVMAGLLAAAISSFASVLNALAATTLHDFYAPLRRAFGREPTEEHLFRLSRALAFSWGLVLLVVALAFQGSSDNVLNIALKVLTYFYGALLGTFLLGAFTRRGSGSTVIAGMLLGVVTVLVLQLRHFIENPSLAPESVRALVSQLPKTFTSTVAAHVPMVAWPYWIIVGTAITFAVGSLGSRGPVAK